MSLRQRDRKADAEVMWIVVFGGRFSIRPNRCEQESSDHSAHRCEVPKVGEVSKRYVFVFESWFYCDDAHDSTWAPSRAKLFSKSRYRVQTLNIPEDSQNTHFSCVRTEGSVAMEHPDPDEDPAKSLIPLPRRSRIQYDLKTQGCPDLYRGDRLLPLRKGHLMSEKGESMGNTQSQADGIAQMLQNGSTPKLFVI
jgi:hypothetical protein